MKFLPSFARPSFIILKKGRGDARLILTKLSKEKKDIIIMGDFNIDIIEYDENKDSSEFLDLMYTNFLLP